VLPPGETHGEPIVADAATDNAADDSPANAATNNRQHRSTEADGCPWTFGRAGRQELTSVPRLVVVEPPPESRDSRFTESEKVRERSPSK